MDKINQAISTLSKELNEHKEKFAAAFLKETGLDPTQVVMLQRNVGNYLDVDIWFRRKTEKEIELERRSETTAAMLRYCPDAPAKPARHTNPDLA